MSRSLQRFAPLLLTLVACVTPNDDFSESNSDQKSALLPVIAICTEVATSIKIDPETHEVNGTGTLSGCTAIGHPAIHSGTIDIRGTALVTPLELVTFTTDTITWNTGQIITQSAERTHTGAGAITVAGAGHSLTGLFHPSAATELGTGTRLGGQLIGIAGKYFMQLTQ